MVISKKEVNSWDRKYRLKFINSVSGYKSAHLIGTKSEKGISNVAIFNSIVHISSDPAQIGFFMRPLTVPRNTYKNIIDTKLFTLNHVHQSFLKRAHFTSAKFDSEESEFKKCKLTETYSEGFLAPFVGESNIKLGMKLIEDVSIKSTKCRLLIGEVQFIDIDEKFIEDDGQIDLEKAHDICVTGLNQYSSVKKSVKLPYARVSETPSFQTIKRHDNVVFDEEKNSYNAHLLPYGTNIGAPSIKTNSLSNWKNNSLNNFNNIFQSKIENLKSEYTALIDEYKINDLLYNAKCDFEPIVGNTYHLYQHGTEGNSFLSLIPPSSWDKVHLGSFKLNMDKVWQTDQN